MGGGFFCLAEDKTFPIDWEIVLIVTGRKVLSQDKEIAFFLNQLVLGE